MTEHLDQPLSVDTLAARLAMSARNFARVFAQEFGTTPGHYLLQLRVEDACDPPRSAVRWSLPDEK